MTEFTVDRLGWYETRDHRKACVTEITTQIWHPVHGYILDEKDTEQRSRWFKSGRKQAISPLDYPDNPDFAAQVRGKFGEGIGDVDLIRYLPHHLIRCPFCKHEGKLKDDGGDDVQHVSPMWIVRCSSCGASSGGYKSDAESAVATWNRRSVDG